jgi:hypothetical protein
LKRFLKFLKLVNKMCQINVNYILAINSICDLKARWKFWNFKRKLYNYFSSMCQRSIMLSHAVAVDCMRIFIIYAIAIVHIYRHVIAKSKGTVRLWRHVNHACTISPNMLIIGCQGQMKDDKHPHDTLVVIGHINNSKLLHIYFYRV